MRYSNAEEPMPDPTYLTRRQCLAALSSLPLLGFAARLTPAATPQVVAVRFGKLVDGKGRTFTDAVVIVANGKIASVGTSAPSLPKGTEEIDLKQFTGIPGLIDAHTHLTYVYDPATKVSPLQQPGRLPQVDVFLAQENARKTLETGVTTVRDLGASDFSDVALRDLINRGLVVGPRMFVCGHGLVLRKDGPALSSLKGAVRGAKEIEEFIQVQGPEMEWVKIYGSTGTWDDVTGDPTFSKEDLAVAVMAAHKAKKRVAIHAYGPVAAQAAVEAGADSVEHGADFDEKLLQEMVRKKVVWVPTIDHNRYYAENAKLYGFTAKGVGNLNDYIERNLKTAQRAVKAGVRFAMGSDAVFTMFGENTRELDWFVKAGMTAEEALRTATTNAAALLGQEKTLGAVAPGYAGDLVAVEGSPLKDITAVTRGVRWVMKAGRVVVDRTRKE
jgi:imidazolonepropionase-like amidohydrolase